MSSATASPLGTPPPSTTSSTASPITISKRRPAPDEELIITAPIDAARPSHHRASLRPSRARHHLLRRRRLARYQHARDGGFDYAPPGTTRSQPTSLGLPAWASPEPTALLAETPRRAPTRPCPEAYKPRRGLITPLRRRLDRSSAAASCPPAAASSRRLRPRLDDADAIFFTSRIAAEVRCSRRLEAARRQPRRTSTSLKSAPLLRFLAPDDATDLTDQHLSASRRLHGQRHISCNANVHRIAHHAPQGPVNGHVSASKPAGRAPSKTCAARSA